MLNQIGCEYVMSWTSLAIHSMRIRLCSINRGVVAFPQLLVPPIGMVELLPRILLGAAYGPCDPVRSNR